MAVTVMLPINITTPVMCRNFSRSYSVGANMAPA
jgi:hypothetical protein